MSTPDQPDTPPLTRKQLRELRNTGATPVITAAPEESAAEASLAQPSMEPATAETAEHERTEAEDAGSPHDEPERETPASPVAPLPRPAEPVAVPPAPSPDASVDLGASPLTRRQARQQERIRTASVPVITPDYVAAAPEPAERRETGQPEWAPVAATAAAEPEAPADAEASSEAPAAAETSSEAPHDESAAEPSAYEGRQPEPALQVFESEGGPVASDEEAESEIAATESAERAVLNPMFGAGLLAGEPAPVPLPPSFDQLLTRDTATTGSVATPHALIVSQAPSDTPLVAPITGTGEVLVTGTFALPEGLGSTGHAHGTADGKEVDAILVDGELPAHSSPTPIAASAAVSTVKTNDEIIRPPAPEKGGRLMLTLAITAGVLALALVGVLVYALVSGVVS